MNYLYDAIVIGGGVNGGSITYNLAKRGYKVLLLEKDKIVSKSSSAAAGMLAAQAEFVEDSPLFQLARKSRGKFPFLSKELKDLSGIDIELINKGMLKIAFNDEDVEALKKIINFQQEVGEEVHWLTDVETRKVEPRLSAKIKGAMYIPQDGHVSAPQLSYAFIKSAAKLGAEIREFVDVLSFIVVHGKVKGVNTSEGSFLSENVIVACGAWSNRILKEAGMILDTYPVKGECFSVQVNRPLLEKTVFSHSCYLVPKAGGRLIVGATSIPDTYDQNVSIDGIYTLVERAKMILPSIIEAKWEKTWAGIRPQTVDELPFLGNHPDLEGLFIATGHYRNGILLSPITGELIADLIDGNPATELKDFRVDRNRKIEVN